MKKNIGKPEDVVKLFSSWKDDIKIVLAEKEREKKNLDHQITLKQVELSRLNDGISRERAEFEQWKRGETQKFENEKNLQRSEIEKKEHQVEDGSKTGKGFDIFVKYPSVQQPQNANPAQ